MTSLEILSIIITFLCLTSFCIVFTFLFRAYFKNSIKNINDGKEDIELIDQAIIDEQKKHSKKQKALNITKKVVSWTLFGIVLAMFSVSIVAKFLDNTLFFNNTTIVVIGSGSMSKQNDANTYLKENNLNNQINTYDIIGIQKYEKEEDVKLYDVVAFKSKDGTTIVHRIINIQYDDNGHHYYTTRGDSNAVSDNGSLYDGYLTYDKLIGHYNNFKIPVLGSFVVFLQSGSGIITIVSIIYCFVMFDIYKHKMDEAILNRSNLLIELIDVKQDDELSISNNFQQELIYKGVKYTFKNGEFIDKTTIDDQKLIDASVNNMVFINENNNNKTIKVRDTKNKTTKQISNTEDILEKDKHDCEKEE